MSPKDTKKGSFLDRFSSKETKKVEPADDSMLLDTDLIHEGISDDDLDMLLSGDIKSSAKPPKNPSPAEFAEEEIDIDSLDNVLDDDFEEQSLPEDELSLIDEDELLELDELDDVLNDTAELQIIDNTDEVDTLSEQEHLSSEILSTQNADSNDNLVTEDSSNMDLEEVDLITPLENQAEQTAVSAEATIPVLSSLTSSSINKPKVSSLELADKTTPDIVEVPNEQIDLSAHQVTDVTLDVSTVKQPIIEESASEEQLTQENVVENPIEANNDVTESVVELDTSINEEENTAVDEINTVKESPVTESVDKTNISDETSISNDEPQMEAVNLADNSETLTNEVVDSSSDYHENTVDTSQLSAEDNNSGDISSSEEAINDSLTSEIVANETVIEQTPAESMKAELTNSLPSFTASILAGATATGIAAATTTNTEKDNSSETVASTNTETSNSVESNEADTLKTVIHEIPDSVRSRLKNADSLESTPVSNSSVDISDQSDASSVELIKPSTIKVVVARNDADKKQTSNKPSLSKPLGKNTMTNDSQIALIEKVQVDIDELKRKLHSMNSDFYNAATDSAVLISQVRELETKSAGSFSGTYSQSRELRRSLVEARKIFNQLASGIDMLEESLETDLFEVENKA